MKSRYEVNEELYGWCIWDNEKNEYIGCYDHDEQYARARCEELNEKDEKDEQVDKK